MERWFARQVDVVIANSRMVAEGLGPLPVQVVANPVDVDRFSPARSGRCVRQEFGIAQDAPVIGVVGRITVWKGHQTFIEAMQRVIDCAPTARALIVGEQFERCPEADERELRGIRERFGTELDIPSQVVFREQDLRALTRELGLQDHVVFTGFRQDIPDVMAALDLLVLPSWWEPFGRVLIEAMASGTPVVATNLGGPPEIVRDGETGYLIPPLDSVAMADAICGILNRPHLRAAMGKQGRVEAERRFSLSEYVNRITAIYENCEHGMRNQCACWC
jgi:glycosyltransferase involved in cell wall biosynthesis